MAKAGTRRAGSGWRPGAGMKTRWMPAAAWWPRPFETSQVTWAGCWSGSSWGHRVARELQRDRGFHCKCFVRCVQIEMMQVLSESGWVEGAAWVSRFRGDDRQRQSLTMGTSLTAATKVNYSRRDADLEQIYSFNVDTIRCWTMGGWEHDGLRSND